LGACRVSDGADSFLPRFSVNVREERSLVTGGSQPTGLVLAAGKEMIWGRRSRPPGAAALLQERLI
jgi:hypothetical protein